MSNTFWGERAPGSDVSQGTDDPSVLLIAPGMPDWVAFPDMPEFGDLVGQRVRVSESFEAPCPMCEREHEGDAPLVTHIAVKDGWCVAECLEHKFVWYCRA